MKNRININYMETCFLAAKYWKDRGNLQVDLVRKVPAIPGQYSDIIDIYTKLKSLYQDDNVFFLLDAKDSHLLMDAQAVGFRFQSYLFQSEDGNCNQDQISFPLWEYPNGVYLNEIGFQAIVEGEARSDAITRCMRISLQEPVELYYPFRANWKIYFNLCLSRERFIFGLSGKNNNYRPKKKLTLKFDKNLKKSFLFSKRKNFNFLELVSKRRSHDFPKWEQRQSSISLDIISNIVNDSFIWKEDFEGKSRPFPTAGGLSRHYLLIALENHPRILKVPTEATYPDLKPDEQLKVTFAEIQKMFSTQSHLAGVQGWVFLVSDLEELLIKYGPRGYSLGSVDAGAFAQTFCLSCESFGIRSRLISGFDDLLFRRLFALKEFELVKVMIAFGARSEAE